MLCHFKSMHANDYCYIYVYHISKLTMLVMGETVSQFTDHTFFFVTDWDGIRNLVSALPQTVKRLVLVSSIGVTKYNEIPWRYIPYDSDDEEFWYLPLNFMTS
jgi:nucleoside-diphosphate-sugar epimerase